MNVLPRLVRVTRLLCLGSSLLLAGGTVAAADAGAVWSTRESAGRLEVIDPAGKLVFGWQSGPLANPKGGAKFAGSAFLHPLTTPAGFEVTAIQPPDHLHHFGLWWPWKFLQVDGRKLNGWEIQDGQARHLARSAKVVRADAAGAVIELTNAVEQLADHPQPEEVLTEKTRLAVARPAPDRNVLDFLIDQRPAGGRQVQIGVNHYSGFSWRGPLAWNQSNSKLFTSEGDDRDHANGRPARWACVTGPGKGGPASVLILSGAVKRQLAPERLRVWDSKNSNGMPFVNFNPVATAPLDAAAPAIARRAYRMLLVDGELSVEAAERAWQDWKPSTVEKNADGK